MSNYDGRKSLTNQEEALAELLGAKCKLEEFQAKFESSTTSMDALTLFRLLKEVIISSKVLDGKKGEIIARNIISKVKDSQELVHLIHPEYTSSRDYICPVLECLISNLSFSSDSIFFKDLPTIVNCVGMMRKGMMKYALAKRMVSTLPEKNEYRTMLLLVANW